MVCKLGRSAHSTSELKQLLNRLLFLHVNKHPLDRSFSGVFRALDEFGRAKGYSISDGNGARKFVEEIGAWLCAHQKDPKMIHGFRIQGMFAYVAAALGHCEIITEEDSGEFYSSLEHLKRPDFRLLTIGNAEFFVEVKNFKQPKPFKEFRLKRKYAEQILAYAEAFKKPLYFAIYWASWRVWTLNPLSCFSEGSNGFVLRLEDAVKSNHMNVLGDALIGIPKSLVLRFFTNPTEPRTEGVDGTTPFTISRVEYHTGGRMITDPTEQKLAWFFLQFGHWDELTHPAEIKDGELVSFDFAPTRYGGNPEQEFQLIGSLSTMISLQYNRFTVDDGAVNRLIPNIVPEKLGVRIASDYKGEVLKLWRFSLVPPRDEMKA